jgi:hypothetical protein
MATKKAAKSAAKSTARHAAKSTVSELTGITIPVNLRWYYCYQESQYGAGSYSACL